ncbi:MAG: FAD/NAD(P)-binding protein [Atopostipes suicloacalis]|nr:FAD/NAD(P)-binding protein [Atopostipes suicloacalis]MDN6730784.1 FAD/NAD(P)-binding protein [Atopostipes suicloacalis]
MKIAIVGAGISGASILQTILDHPHLKEEDQIHLFEPREKIGVGFPYSSNNESAMLNISPDSLSMIDEKPLDFTHWLAENYEEPTNFEKLVSRPQYGQYLEERFKKYANHEQVTHFKTKVLDIQVYDALTKKRIFESKSGHYLYRLKTSEDWRGDFYGAVFLALGHPDYADYYHLNGQDNYIANPYPMEEKLSEFTSQDRIGIIGSGATGIDLMRFFASHYHLKEPLTFYVQDQGFYFSDIPYEGEEYQFSFSMDWIEKEKAKNNGIIPFNVILSTLIYDIQTAGVDLIKVYGQYKKGDLATIRKAVESKDQKLALIHAYHSQLIAFLPHLFNSLSGQDKEIYLKDFHTKMLFFKSRVPFETFKWLFELIDQGKIRILHGLEDIERNVQGGFTAFADKVEEVDYFINATGFDSRLSEVSKGSKLINQLYYKNIILPQWDGRFVLIDWPQAQVVNQKFGLMNNLFFSGLLVGGSQHENNDAQLTHQLARRSANYLMNQRKN